MIGTLDGSSVHEAPEALWLGYQISDIRYPISDSWIEWGRGVAGAEWVK